MSKIRPMTKSGITWCDYSWHPLTGCTRVSPACDRCYAEALSGTRLAHLERYKDTTRKTARGPRWTGTLKTHPELLAQPAITKKAGRVFVCGMSDLFHEKVPATHICAIFRAMLAAPHHQYICLTKRPERIREVERHSDFPGWAPCIWMGTTIEHNDFVGRADHLRNCGALVKWVSAEPLLGPLDRLDLTDLHWLVIAGESGRGARTMDLGWVDDLMSRCQASKVACHVKQLGEAWTRAHGFRGHGTKMEQWPDRYRVRDYPAPPPAAKPPRAKSAQGRPAMSTCVHEAAHALAALSLNLAVDLITVDGEAAGSPHVSIRHSSDTSAIDLGIVYAAGSAATARYARTSTSLELLNGGWHDRDDLRTALPDPDDQLRAIGAADVLVRDLWSPIRVLAAELRKRRNMTMDDVREWLERASRDAGGSDRMGDEGNPPTLARSR